MDLSGTKLLIANQVTSLLFRQLVDSFAAAGADVKLVAGFLERNEGYRPRYRHIPACDLIKAPAWKRMWTWGRFTWRTFRAMSAHRDHFALLATIPPLVPWVAPLARRLFGLRYAVFVTDIYPDLLVRMKMIREDGLLHRLLRRLAAASLLRADHVITLSQEMEQTLRRQLPSGEDVKITVIPNWVDTGFIEPVPRRENPFALEHDLVGKFVVMYSGAFGATHDIESIVEAAESLTDLEDVRFVLIGKGTRGREVDEYVRQKALPNLLRLPWQTLEMVRYSLTCADCHIVSLDLGYQGISMPSKTYTSLASEAAILAVSPPGTELVNLLSRHDCGIWIRPRNADDLVQAIRKLHGDRDLLRRYQRNARSAAERCYDVRVCTEKYHELLGPSLARMRSAGRNA